MSRRPTGTEPWERPAPADRAAHSDAIERRIRTASARIADADLRRLLEGTLPNTLDTTIVAGGSDARPDTFVLTGDIEAMWLRDSAAQVWPYIASVRDDADLDRLIRGVIHRQSDQILLDPYANAFLSDDRPSEWADDQTEMRPGVHERKWEPDSLLAFFRLSAAYADASRSLRPFDAEWRGAVELALRTLRAEQRIDGGSPYRFRRLDGDPTDDVPNLGQGASSRPNGMVHGAFRPSDDASLLPLNVPVNLALAAALDGVAAVAAATGTPALLIGSRRPRLGHPGRGRAGWARAARSGDDLGLRGGRPRRANADGRRECPEPPLAPVLRSVRGGRPGLSRHPPVGPLARQPVVVPWPGR